MGQEAHEGAPIAVAPDSGSDYRDGIQTAEKVLGCVRPMNVWLYEPRG